MNLPKSDTELKALATELRRQIIDVCSANGGHIGASLGAVEITLALHSEFSTPRDSIIWDVGHQTYAHKLLTRDQKTFLRLRQKGGPSGFTAIEESEHDAFGAGHSSTSISAALGIAEAKRLKGDTTWTVAVIGDGGLTAGLAFEALNQAGASQEPRLIIVVNDNNLSISPNVGALNRWAFGAEREPRKYFESLGFNYIGPIDGHDIGLVRSNLKTLKAGSSERVSVLHVITKKGKGFEPAENEPIKFHGVGPFDKLTGKTGSKSAAPTFSSIFGTELTELAKSDKRIIAITAAMAEGTGLVRFSETHPDRFYDVGIAEPHALVFAAGMATQELRPVVAIYSTFLQRAVDSFIHDIALQKLDVTLAIDRAGLVGADGPTHHGAFDIPILRTVPGVTIAAPATANDLRSMLAESIARGGINAIRYPRGEAPADSHGQTLAWGKARLLTKPNNSKTELVIWTLGTATNWAREALALLDEHELDRLTLVDARFAKPIDTEMLAQTLSGNVRGLITIEDGSRAGGFGAALLEASTDLDLKIPQNIARLGIDDTWVKHAEVGEQRDQLGLSATGIAQRIRDMLDSK